MTEMEGQRMASTLELEPRGPKEGYLFNSSIGRRQKLVQIPDFMPRAIILNSFMTFAFNLFIFFKYGDKNRKK